VLEGENIDFKTVSSSGEGIGSNPKKSVSKGLLAAAGAESFEPVPLAESAAGDVARPRFESAVGLVSRLAGWDRGLVVAFGLGCDSAAVSFLTGAGLDFVLAGLALGLDFAEAFDADRASDFLIPSIPARKSQ
jgi:hypothetical protein